MVTFTRLTGAVFALNPDLIERVDRTPDTIITLVDGTKYLVQESLEDVVKAIRRFRASVLSAAAEFEGASATEHQPTLTAVPARAEAPVVPFPRGEA